MKHTGIAKLKNVLLRLYPDLKRQYLSLLHNFCILLNVMRSNGKLYEQGSAAISLS
ncbi:hypothetical protein ACFSTB_13775 [Sphingobacterium chuzhouense]